MPAVGRFRYVEALPRGVQSSSRARGSAHSERTLVLLHAFPLNARMWEPQLPLADEGWRVLAPQFRGFDASSAPSGGDAAPAATSIDDYAADLVDLLDALRIEDAVVCGCSMGGYVALALVRLAPRYIRGLVLADSRPHADTPEGIDGRKRLLALLAEHGPPAIADQMVPRLLSDATRRDQPDVVARVRELTLANSRAAIAGAIAALMTRPDSTSLLSTIHCPTLILVGEQDVVTPPDVGAEMHRAIAGSELVVIPGAGHLPNLEQPAAFNEALARFLEHRV